MNKKSDILLIEACNFVSAPQGGQLTAARMLMKALGNRLALCGWTDDPCAPLGVWHKRTIDGVAFDFLAIDCMTVNVPKRPLVPARLTAWINFKRHSKAILSCGISTIMTSEPTVMMALTFSKKNRVCYWFPGIEPALSVSRYRWAKWVSSLFDGYLNRRLHDHASILLAAADAAAIDSLRHRAKGLLDHAEIKVFPTRVDTTVFHPSPDSSTRIGLRVLLQLPVAAQPLVVTSGRIHRAKGWPLLLDAFAKFREQYSLAHLVFIGDGSDRGVLESAIAERHMEQVVILVGFQCQEKLAAYLRSADLFVMGSEKEGWCTSLVEALACGLPIVTTRFSSADSLVCEGVNGYIVNRDVEVFATAMNKALLLPNVSEISQRHVTKYALSSFRNDILGAVMLAN